ncbi:MAG TPA: hypothetical protein VGD67_08815 [Pseudonocardiaceae bacterium]
MNEHFVQSELEYRRQQRLAGAAQHRQARRARQVPGTTLRQRLQAVVEHLTPGHRQARAADGGTPAPAHRGARVTHAA